jgi:predicted pyridoxine 5'-phosphate oxidase superfamily flavin-nucleotide-binding protein
MDFYQEDQRRLQDQFETRRLADTLEASIVSEEITDEHAQFISTRDFFFLSTVNAAGEPTVSYKGGPVGMVHIVNPKTVLFPIYDGNGMFLSAGNVAASAKIGMLFIDFETPHRVRLQATALVNTRETPGVVSRSPCCN